MGINFRLVHWSGPLLNRQIASATIVGLKRAAVYYHGQCRLAVNVPNKHRAKKKLSAGQSARRGGQKTATLYENMHNAYAGTPPFKRTGFGQSGIVWESNDSAKDPAVRVGIRANAIYMIYLELGTRRIRPRPWLVATLLKHRTTIGMLAATGGRSQIR